MINFHNDIPYYVVGVVDFMEKWKSLCISEFYFVIE